MHRFGCWVFAGTLALGGLGGTALARGHGEEHEGKKVTMDQLPAKVQSTFQKEASGGQVEELRSQQKGGKTIYSGEIVQNGKGTELKVSDDGSILKRGASHDEATEKEHGGEK